MSTPTLTVPFSDTALFSDGAGWGQGSFETWTPVVVDPSDPWTEISGPED